MALTIQRAMELRRAADALIRSNASPLSNLLIPSSNIRWASQRQLTPKYTCAPPSRRNFATSNRRNAIRPAITSAPPTAPESDSTTEEASKDPHAKDDIIEQLSDNLWAQRPSQATSSLFPKLSPLQTAIRSSGTDSSSLLSGYSRASQNRAPDSGRFDLSRMMDPPSSSIGGPGPLSIDLMQNLDGIAPPAPVRKVPLRLNPSMGRHVSVTQTVDVGRAFKMVDMNCSRNKIKGDSNRQRFHERPGLKRKRLASQRWRVRFQAGFRATVNRVKQLKRQGW